jgi:gliding motility-associated-like protein
MNNSITIIEDSGPDPVNLVAENEGLYCEGGSGVEISLETRQDGVIYGLYYSSVDAANFLTEPDDLNSFGVYTDIGNYILQGYIEGGCDAIPLDTVTVGYDAVPQAYSLSVEGHLCDSTGSAIILLENSETNVDYQLYFDDGSGFIYTGTSFTGEGDTVQITVYDAGSYYIEGFFNDGTSACSSVMADTVYVESVSYPEQIDWTVEPGVDCSTGAEISIDSMEADVTYELYRYDSYLNDTIATGNVADASGSFEPVVDGDGYYYIYASHLGCGKFMDSGEDTIHVEISGVPVVYSAYGEDAVCEGDGSTSVMLSGIETGVTYYLYRYDTDSTASVVDSIDGSDSYEVDFEVYSEGVYYIEADMSGCVVTMTGEVEVTFNPLPVAFKMTGSGIYCGADAGAVLGLEGSELDVLYTLVDFDGVVYDSDVPGTGSAIEFTAQNVEGQYRVYAKNQVTGCTSSMNDSVIVQYLDEPDTLSVTATLSSDDGLYCSSESGITVTISDVESGVTYSLVDLSSGETTNSILATTDGGTVELLATDLSTDGEGTDLKIIASYDESSCAGALDTIHVTTEEAPDAPVIVFPTENSLSVCSYDAYIKVFPYDTDVDYTLVSDVSLDVFDDPAVVNDTLVWDLTDGLAGSFIYVEASIDGHCPVSSRFISVNILDGVDPFVLNADNGLYCEGTGGVTIEVDSTTEGVYYELYQEGLSEPVYIIKGNGSAKSFTPVTGDSIGVNYYVQMDGSTVCSSIDTDTVTVIEVPVPDYQILNDSILSGVNTMLWLSDSEGPNTFLPSIWMDTVFYQSYIYDIPDIDYILGSYISGDGEAISLDTVEVSGNAIYYAKRNVYNASGDSILGCWANFDDAEPLAIGANAIEAEDFYLFVPVDENTVGVNLSDYVTPNYIPKDELIFTFSESVANESDDDDNKLIWQYDAESVSTGDSVNLIDLDFSTLASLRMVDQDSCVFARNSSVLYGVITADYTVSNDDYGEDDGTITIVIGNAEGVDDGTFILPNAFSPNGDGLNDEFIIEGLNFSDYLDPETHLTVFNRWGTIVYQSKGSYYGSGDDGWWDGTSNNSNMVSIGDELPNGTYFYVLTVKFFSDEGSVDKDFAGFVELRR